MSTLAIPILDRLLTRDDENVVKLEVGQMIGFCRLLPRAFGPQNLDAKIAVFKWGGLPTCGRLPIGLVELQILGRRVGM
jgi:hypothetical protein